MILILYVDMSYYDKIYYTIVREHYYIFQLLYSVYVHIRGASTAIWHPSADAFRTQYATIISISNSSSTLYNVNEMGITVNSEQSG